MRTGKEVGDASPILESCGGLPRGAGLLVLAFHPASRQADDSGFLGRLFRLGGSSSSSSSPSSSAPSTPGRLRERRIVGIPDIGTAAFALGPAAVRSFRMHSRPDDSGRRTAPTSGPSTPIFPLAGRPAPAQPRPRVSPAVTTADPLLTRMALGRSNDGSQFGMLLQIFTDGTVIDSEGVHRLSASDLRPLVDAIQNGELSRVRGHCGTPSNDFIEYVHIVVFEPDGPAAGTLVLLRRQPSGLRQWHPLPAHGPGKPPGEAQPPAGRE